MPRSASWAAAETLDAYIAQWDDTYSTDKPLDAGLPGPASALLAEREA